MHIYLQTVSEIEDPLWPFSSDWNRTLPWINSSGTQKYSITQLLMCAAENSQTHPNWKRINSAVCWSSSLRTQRSLVAAPIACRQAPYEQEQFSGYNLEDWQLEKILESRCMRRFIQSIMNGLRYSWNRLHPQTQILKSNSNNGFNIKTTQNQLSNRQMLRINIKKPSKSTVNVKIATETVLFSFLAELFLWRQHKRTFHRLLVQNDMFYRNESVNLCVSAFMLVFGDFWSYFHHHQSGTFTYRQPYWSGARYE